MTNVDTLLLEISPESPCGPDLSSDLQFMVMETSARGKPESMIGGDAEPPNWREVLAGAVTLLGRTKDLRVAIPLTRALLHLEGLAGFRDGLRLIQHLVETQWAAVHPLPEPDGDVTYRLNTLAALRDSSGLLLELTQAPLVHSPEFGALSLREARAGLRSQPSGENGDGEAPRQAIEATIRSCSVEDLQGVERTIDAIIQSVSATETAIAGKTSASLAPRFDELKSVLGEMKQLLKPYITGMDRPDTPIDVAPGPIRTQGGSTSGQVRGRQDVVRLLDAICAYYYEHEPSSPVPVLLERAKRLVPKRFMDVIRDVAPSGEDDAKRIWGPEQAP